MVIKDLKQFARDTNTDLLQPKLRKLPAELLKVLPYGLSALTTASKKQLPVRFAVFAEALEEQAPTIGAAAGQEARALLQELATVTAARDQADKNQDDTIGALGADWQQLCAGLWQTHCKALDQFQADPKQARAFFNYDLLPDYNAKRAAMRRANQTA